MTGNKIFEEILISVHTELAKKGEGFGLHNSVAFVEILIEI